MRNNKGQFKKGTHWRERRPWWDKKWLNNQYTICKRSASDIAKDGNVGETAILYWLVKHDIPRRTMKEIRSHKHWGLSGADNPMWNKYGDLNPRWLGGITPERQSFYQSQEWKTACSFVWKRDMATCQRCNIEKQESPDIPFHIHHIISFANEELRADTDNLILMCEICHQFIHSKRNINNEYISEK